MEALFILIGELIAVPLTLVLTLLIEAFFALLAGVAWLVELVFGVSLSFRRKKEPAVLTQA